MHVWLVRGSGCGLEGRPAHACSLPQFQVGQHP